MEVRTPLLLALVLSACGTSPPPTPVTVESTPNVPLVVGSGDAKRPVAPPPPSEGTEPLDDQPALKGKQVGAKAPGFTLESFTGKPATPFKNRITVIHFWATWCAPCKKSLPALQALYDKKHGSGLDVIALSVDDEDSGVAQFAGEAKVTFAVGWEADKRVAVKYQVSSMPSTYVIDRQGTIRFLHEGYRDGEDAALAKEIEGLL